jgi:hypothetical protein
MNALCMSCPIAFIHQGPPVSSSHLNSGLLQARLWNPGRCIFVITDENPSDLLAVPGIEIIHPEPFRSGAMELREVYCHLSANGEHFERACLERWFILRDFMKSRQLSNVWHFDSDVMIYTDLEEETARVAELDFTLTQGSGHSSYFTMTGLEKLCEFILKSYRAEPATGWLQACDQARIQANNRNRISDMFFIAELSKDPSLKSVNMHQPQPGHAVFDANANAHTMAEREGELREISFVDNRPYSTEDPALPQQRYATLHFQGAAKRHMPSHLRPPPGPPPAWCIPVFSQLLSQLRELSLQSLKPAKAAQPIQHVTLLPAQKKEAEKANKSVIKFLRKLRASRWLRLGQILKVSRAGSQLDEAIERLRK